MIRRFSLRDCNENVGSILDIYQQLLGDYNQLTTEKNKCLQSYFKGKRKLPFECCLSSLPTLDFFVDAVSQRDPNVPLAFFSTKHR
jgi:hypothetical protein